MIAPALREHIPALLSKSISDTFGIQIAMPLEMEITDVTAQKLTKDIPIACMSVLGLSAKDHQGSLAIGFPTATFVGILQNMIGETHEKIDETNSDASGEILNIIYGDFRKKLNALGFEFQPAIPSTVLGSDISLQQANAHLSFSIKAKCAAGPFQVIITMTAIAAKA